MSSQNLFDSIYEDDAFADREKQRNQKRTEILPTKRLLRIALLVGTLGFLFLYLYVFHRPSWATRKALSNPSQATGVDSRLHQLDEIKQWRPDPGQKVVGLVFFGRRRFVKVLNCYLQRNLAKNGGILDEIIFVAKTADKDDLAYLSELLSSEPRYSAQYINSTNTRHDYSHNYASCERGTVYVKIDDDVLYIADHTIRSMVKKKLEHPEYLTVSANIVGNYASSWLHQHFGAIHPFLPDLSDNYTTPTSWRPSELPYWTNPSQLPHQTKPSDPLHTPSSSGLSWDDWIKWQAPEHVRLLPLPAPPNRTDTIFRTPIASLKEGGSSGLDYIEAPKGWLKMAQLHYSLMQNLERDELWRYAFDTWVNDFERFSINLFVMTGDDILDMQPVPAREELYISKDLPEKTGRAFVADGFGLAAHHGYASNEARNGDRGLENTDVLDSYRLYAEENVCGQ